MVIFLSALYICMLLHLLAIAVTGVLCGVSLRMFSFGIGPTAFSRGKFRLGLIPTGGYVRFLNSSDEEVVESELHKAFDRQSVTKKVAISLSGCAILAVSTLAISGLGTLDSIISAPGQFFIGAISPLNDAHLLISNASAVVQTSGFLTVISIVAAKYCALNAMPLTSLNGGDAVAALAKHVRLDRWWPKQATILLFFVVLGSLLSWTFALATYAYAIV